MQLIEIKFKKKHKLGPEKGTVALVKESTALNWMKSGYAAPTKEAVRKKLANKIKSDKNES